MNLDPVSRAQVLNGDWEVNPCGRVFQRGWFSFVAACARGGRVVRYWDKAATAPERERLKINLTNERKPVADNEVIRFSEIRETRWILLVKHLLARASQRQRGLQVSCINCPYHIMFRLIQMNKSFYLASVFLLLLIASIMFGAEVTNGQEASPIFGYPYSAHQAEGTASGQAPMFFASNFHLDENAKINFMSCKIYIDYDLSLRSFDDTTYRFAIYSDNNGQMGELIGQTELGTVSKPPDDQLPLQIDDFLSLNFDSPVSLEAGNYWLAAVVHGPNVLVYDDMTNQSVQRAKCSLNETTFPLTVTSIQYIDNEVVAIFASGQGVSSVMPPPSVDASNPGMSTISVNCQSEDSSMQVFGTLSLYGTGIPQATIEFSYRQIGEPVWLSIGSTETSADGSYSINWSPSTQGNYLINATYWEAQQLVLCLQSHSCSNNIPKQ